jgi:glycosyltransferase involved in cell wall biosynthesis
MIPSARSAETRTRMKLLLSAYACEPHKGSEPGVGWNMARTLACHHDVWVLTRANNRRSIERELPLLGGRAGTPADHLHFVYYDLPPWTRWWKRGKRGVQPYYYLWQIGVYPAAARLHREIGFDVIHHVTFGKYWTPSLLALLPAPFVWGPVGGGESAPRAFWGDFSLRGQFYETLRDVGRWLGERDRLVRLTARRSALALAKTESTAERLRRLGAGQVRLLSDVGLPLTEINDLGRLPPATGRPVRFISIGNLLDLKGIHLAIDAFARCGCGDAQYWIVGDGPARPGLQRLAETLGCAARIRFWGRLPRDETLRRLAESHVLVHPCLHESGGGVCVEAMAVGRPVICFDLGGPAMQITDETGVKIPAGRPGEAVRDLAEAMRRLALDPLLRHRLGEAGRRRSLATYQWEHKGEFLETMYRQVTNGLHQSMRDKSR